MRISKIEEMNCSELVSMVKIGGLPFLNSLIKINPDVVKPYRKEIYDYAKSANDKTMMRILEKRFKDLSPKSISITIV